MSASGKKIPWSEEALSAKELLHQPGSIQLGLPTSDSESAVSPRALIILCRTADNPMCVAAKDAVQNASSWSVTDIDKWFFKFVDDVLVGLGQVLVGLLGVKFAGM